MTANLQTGAAVPDEGDDSAGGQIARWLTEHEHSQAWLSRQCGVTPKHINHVIHNKANYSRELAQKIAHITGISFEQLLVLQAQRLARAAEVTAEPHNVNRLQILPSQKGRPVRSATPVRTGITQRSIILDDNRRRTAPQRRDRMTDRNLTYIFPVLDRSKSMLPHVSATVEGFDTFITEQRALPGKCLVTLAQFDTDYEVVYHLRDIAEVPSLDLQPRGGTALLDAIGKTINTAGAQLAAMPEVKRPGAVLVPIITDGEENSSKEYTDWDQIQQMITRQQNQYGWLFSYIGANQDAIANAAQLGIRRGQALTFDPAHTDQAFRAVSSLATTYRSETRTGADPQTAATLAAYSDEQRRLVTTGSKK